MAAYDRPSNATMDRLIRPVFRELMFENARSLLRTVNTIVLTADGKSFGGRHACGVLLSLYFMEPGDRKDPFGNCPEIRSVVPVPLQLQMVCNKKVKDLVGRNGERRALRPRSMCYEPCVSLGLKLCCGISRTGSVLQRMLPQTTRVSGRNRRQWTISPGKTHCSSR